MSAPNYKQLTATVAANLLGMSLDPGTLVGLNGLPLQRLDFPNLPALNLAYGGATPVIPGQFNIAGIEKGALTASTTHDIDLTAMKGLQNESVVFAKLLLAFLWVFDPTAGHIVTVDTSTTNGLIAVTGGAAGKAIAGPGIAVGNQVASVPLILGNLNPGITVDTTHKILTLDPGTNNIASYLFVALGIST
jgi:hypothetical protein